MNNQLAGSIISHLSDDLLSQHYKKQKRLNALSGHCYVASEVYFHLSDEPLMACHIHHEGSSHWFLRNKVTDEIVDITARQFETPVPHEQARGTGFLTKLPSKRARILMGRILNE